MWWVDLDNQDNTTYRNVWLHGEVHEEQKGLVYRANSNQFDLPPGRTTKRLRDIRLRDQWYQQGYEAFFFRSGTIPEGNYTYIVSLLPELGADTGHALVRKPGPPRLIAPRDGAQLGSAEKFPMFSWTPPQPSPPGVRYAVRIVEVLPGQTKEEAMRSNPPWFEKRGNVSFSLRYPVSARRLDLGRSYAWQVQALDQNGNLIGSSEIWSFTAGVPLGPPIPTPPPIGVSREVRRVGTYYEVKLTITNNTGSRLRRLELTDYSTGFGCVNDLTLLHGTTGASARDLTSRPATDSATLSAKMTATLEGFDARGVLKLCYHVVPMLFKLPVGATHTIGDSLRINYRIGDDWFVRRSVRPAAADDVDQAFAAADYLLVTNPKQLYAVCPAGRCDEVDHLLTSVARLAKEKSGVLGYIPQAWDGARLRREVQLTAARNRLAPGWGDGGYLLLVGNFDVVPGDEPTDYLYSDLDRDGLPELRVGRIIGDDAQRLAIPIDNSIAQWRGLSGHRYDGTDVLFITGYEGQETFVHDAEAIKSVFLPRARMVHTDYHDTVHTIFAQAVLLKDPVHYDLDINTPNKPSPFTLTDDSLVRVLLRSSAPYTAEQRARALDSAAAIESRRRGVYYRYHTYPDDTTILQARCSIAKEGVRRGNDLIVYYGHGASDGWASVFDAWPTSHCPLEPIDFGGRTPVAFAPSCLTGRYWEGRWSIAEEFLRLGVGAYIGMGWGIGLDHNQLLVYRFGEKYGGFPGAAIGSILNNVKEELVSTHPGDNGFLSVVYRLFLYGDPKFGRRTP